MIKVCFRWFCKLFFLLCLLPICSNSFIAGQPARKLIHRQLVTPDCIPDGFQLSTRRSWIFFSSCAEDRLSSIHKENHRRCQSSEEIWWKPPHCRVNNRQRRMKARNKMQYNEKVSAGTWCCQLCIRAWIWRLVLPAPHLPSASRRIIPMIVFRCRFSSNSNVTTCKAAESGQQRKTCSKSIRKPLPEKYLIQADFQLHSLSVHAEQIVCSSRWNNDYTSENMYSGILVPLTLNIAILEISVTLQQYPTPITGPERLPSGFYTFGGSAFTAFCDISLTQTYSASKKECGKPSPERLYNTRPLRTCCQISSFQTDDRDSIINGFHVIWLCEPDVCYFSI